MSAVPARSQYFRCLVIGIAMIVLPGPAIIVIPAGLAILGTEFLWAQRIRRHLRDDTRSPGQRVVRTPGVRGRRPIDQCQPVLHHLRPLLVLSEPTPQFGAER